LMAALGCADQAPVEPPPAPRTGDYLGEPVPGDRPVIFAAGWISTDLRQRDAAISPDGDHFFYTLWGQGQGALIGVNRRDGVWSQPEVLPFSGVFSDIEPFFDPGGSGLYFASKRPLPGESEAADWNIWFSEGQGGAWAEPRPLASVNGEGDEYYASVTRDGTIYFTAERPDALGGEDIYRARRAGEGWAPAENLGPAVNSPGPEFNAFVSPDESLLLFSSVREGDVGGGDLYFSLRGPDGAWSPAVNLGPAVNSTALDYCPFLTPDGRFLFFSSSRTEPPPSGIRRSYEQIVRDLREPGNGQGSLYWMDARGLFRPSAP